MKLRVLSGYQYLEGLSESEVDRVKTELTLNNPAYQSARRHSKRQVISIPKYLFYYSGSPKCLQVPLGYDSSFLECSTQDVRCLSEVRYPAFTLTLREDQEKAVDAFFTRNKSTTGIICMPTGKGKSVAGLFCASHAMQKTLVIVHKDDLVVGWMKDINLCFDGKVEPGLIKAKSRTIGKQITIATVQTLSRLSTEEIRDIQNEFGMVILDELHHCPASSYEVVAMFNAKYRLGLSATPERNDGLDCVFEFYFGKFVFKSLKRHDDKDILPVRVVKRNSPVSYIPMAREVVRGDKSHWVHDDTKGTTPFDQIPYPERPRIPFLTLDTGAVLSTHTIRMVVEDVLLEYSRGKSVLVFLTQKEHCRYYSHAIRSALESRGENPDQVVLYYGDSIESNSDILRKIEEGEYRITISTYKKATEGTNVKAWGVAMLVSSVNNGLAVEQASGRIRRFAEGKSSPSILYDYRYPEYYTLGNHGMTRDTRYRKLSFTMDDVRKPLFSRGYKKP